MKQDCSNNLLSLFDYLRYYWVVPESPRWLLSRNRIDEAESIIQRIARINKRTLPTNYLLSLQVSPYIYGGKYECMMYEHFFKFSIY